MAVLYKKTPFDTEVDPVSMTEQEHMDSCDINKMVKNLFRGMDVRQGDPGVYGYDDTTMDPVQFRIQKQQLEEELQKAAAENEFTDDELKHVPPEVQKKFGFKKKAKVEAPAKNDDLNDKKSGALNNKPPENENPNPGPKKETP